MVPDLLVEMRYRHLGRFRIRLRRNRSLWLRNPEEFELAPFSMLAQLVRKGDVVADIGANIGLYTRFLLGWTAAGSVIAFEPWKGNRDLLLENLRLGGVTGRVRVLPYAVADREGKLQFQVDDVQSTSGSLDFVRGGAASEGRSNLGLSPQVIRVPCRTLDDLVASGEIPAPSVLKIDVEGAEAHVLLGSQHLLRDRRPRLLIELHGVAEARQVLEMLLAQGYEVLAQVQPTFDGSGFARLTANDLQQIRGRYDVRYFAATADGDLPDRGALGRSPFTGA